jgi:hypothetical protein
MRAILIDPFTRSITEIDYSGNYEDIYTLIGRDTFTVAAINNRGDGIFVDDEGLLKPGQEFFWHDGYPQPLAGKGLVLGCDEDGETVEPTVSTAEVAKHTRFMTIDEIREEFK